MSEPFAQPLIETRCKKVSRGSSDNYITCQGAVIHMHSAKDRVISEAIIKILLTYNTPRFIDENNILSSLKLVQ